MAQKQYDIIIVGGGIMGSSTAYNLMKTDPALKVGVVEMDPSYERASTTLSMANVRLQFSFRENVEISKYAVRVLENFEEEMRVNGNGPDISFRQEGNLFLVDPKGEAAARQALAMQQKMGCEVAWWSADDIQKQYPLYEVGNMVGGTFGSKDGHFDAYTVLMGYKAKARSMGAEYITGEVVEILKADNRATGVKLAAGDSLPSQIVLNCAGAWAAKVAAGAGVALPVDPVKRQVFCVDSAIKPQGPLPLTILPSGLYFRTETGGTLLVGKSNPDDPVGINFTTDDTLFMETYWPELWEFVPDFEALKIVRGWAGLYAVNTLDQQAILGEWPELKNLYLCNGFSGHGLQQAPAASRYLAELITGASELSMDLSLFSPRRILEKRPIDERSGWEIV